MAEIKSPLSGGLRVARRTVSADAFVKVSAPPPASSQPDPVTTRLIQRNSLALNTVSQQLAALTQQVNSLNFAMQNVYGNIIQSNALERRKDAQEQEQERRLAEQQLREGKESAIERKIQTALVSPVQKIASKASFTLSRVMQFFTTLLAGWLLKQGLETIKAYSEGNKKKLTEIRDSVLKNLAVVGGIYAGIRFGLVAVFNVLSRVAARISSALLSGLFLKPVQALLDGVKGAANKIIPKIRNILPSFGGKKTPPSTSKTSPSTTSQASKQVPQQGINKFAPSSLLQGALSGALIGGGIDTLQGEDPSKAIVSNAAGGATAATTANILTKIPGPIWLKSIASITGGFLIYGPATEKFKEFYDKTTEIFGKKSDADASSQPTENIIPDSSFNFNNSSTNQRETENIIPDVSSDSDNLSTNQSQTENIDSNLTQQAPEQNFKEPPQYGNVDVESTQTQQISEKTEELAPEAINNKQEKIARIDISESEKIGASEAKIFPIKQKITEKMESVRPLSEPTPTIIPMPMGGSTASRSKSTNQSSDLATSIPSINPENPNNFYVVYSHSIYNVPMT